MRLTTTLSLPAIAFIQCLAPAIHAQTAPATPSSSATASIIQAQLAARGPAGKVGGAEADAIYKHYLEGIGHPLTKTNDVASGSSSGSGMSSSASSSGGN